MNANAQPSISIFPSKGSTQSATALAAGIQKLATTEDNINRQRVAVENCLTTIFRFALSALSTGANFRLWGGNTLSDPASKSVATSCLLQCLGTGTATTSGTQAAIAGTGLPIDGMYMADRVTFTPSSTTTTPKGPMSGRADATQEVTHDLFSPADDTTPAELTVSAGGRFSFFIVEWVDGSGVRKFALISRHEI